MTLKLELIYDRLADIVSDYSWTYFDQATKISIEKIEKRKQLQEEMLKVFEENEMDQDSPDIPKDVMTSYLGIIKRIEEDEMRIIEEE